MNGKIEKFEDIIAWQKAHQLSLEVYRNFSQCRDYSFRDQIQRAVVSVMNNIAEGFERSGDKELNRFFFIAKGSCGEVRSMLYLALDLKYVNEKEFDIMYLKATEISRMLSGFIKKLNK
jgi:four helix bundle protein